MERGNLEFVLDEWHKADGDNILTDRRFFGPTESAKSVIAEHSPRENTQIMQLMRSGYFYYEENVNIINNLLKKSIYSSDESIIQTLFRLRRFDHRTLDRDWIFYYPCDWGYSDRFHIDISPLISPIDFKNCFKYTPIKIGQFTSGGTSSSHPDTWSPGRAPSDPYSVASGIVLYNHRQKDIHSNFVTFKCNDQYLIIKDVCNIIYFKSPVIVSSPNEPAPFGPGSAHAEEYRDENTNEYYHKLIWDDIGYFSIYDVYADLNLLYLYRMFDSFKFSNRVKIQAEPVMKVISPATNTFQKINGSISSPYTVVNKTRFAGIKRSSKEIYIHDTLNMAETYRIFSTDSLIGSQILKENRSILYFDIDCDICVIFVEDILSRDVQFGAYNAYGEIIAYDILSGSILWTRSQSGFLRHGNGVEIVKTENIAKIIYAVGRNNYVKIRVLNLNDGSYSNTYSYTQLFEGAYTYATVDGLASFHDSKYYMFTDYYGVARVCDIETGNIALSINLNKNYWGSRSNIQIVGDYLYFINLNLDIEIYDIPQGVLIDTIVTNTPTYTVGNYRLAVGRDMFIIEVRHSTIGWYHYVSSFSNSGKYSFLYSGFRGLAYLKINSSEIAIASTLINISDTGDRVHELYDLYNFEQSGVNYNNGIRYAFSPASQHIGGAMKRRVTNRNNEFICMSVPITGCSNILYARLEEGYVPPTPPVPIPEEPLTACEQTLLDRMIGD